MISFSDININREGCSIVNLFVCLSVRNLSSKSAHGLLTLVKDGIGQGRSWGLRMIKVSQVWPMMVEDSNGWSRMNKGGQVKDAQGISR